MTDTDDSRTASVGRKRLRDGLDYSRNASLSPEYETDSAPKKQKLSELPEPDPADNPLSNNAQLQDISVGAVGTADALVPPEATPSEIPKLPLESVLSPLEEDEDHASTGDTPPSTPAAGSDTIPRVWTAESKTGDDITGRNSGEPILVEDSEDSSSDEGSTVESGELQTNIGNPGDAANTDSTTALAGHQGGAKRTVLIGGIAITVGQLKDGQDPIEIIESNRSKNIFSKRCPGRPPCDLAKSGCYVRVDVKIKLPQGSKKLPPKKETRAKIFKWLATTELALSGLIRVYTPKVTKQNKKYKAPWGPYKFLWVYKDDQTMSQAVQAIKASSFPDTLGYNLNLQPSVKHGANRDEWECGTNSADGDYFLKPRLQFVYSQLESRQMVWDDYLLSPTQLVVIKKSLGVEPSRKLQELLETTEPTPGTNQSSLANAQGQSGEQHSSNALPHQGDIPPSQNALKHPIPGAAWLASSQSSSSPSVNADAFSIGLQLFKLNEVLGGNQAVRAKLSQLTSQEQEIQHRYVELPLRGPQHVQSSVKDRAVLCLSCRDWGHMADVCATSYGSDATVDTHSLAVRMASIAGDFETLCPPSELIVSCYCCGSKKHWGNDCPQSRARGLRVRDSGEFTIKGVANRAHSLDHEDGLDPSWASAAPQFQIRGAHASQLEAASAALPLPARYDSDRSFNPRYESGGHSRGRSASPGRRNINRANYRERDGLETDRRGWNAAIPPSELPLLDDPVPYRPNELEQRSSHPLPPHRPIRMARQSSIVNQIPRPPGLANDPFRPVQPPPRPAPQEHRAARAHQGYTRGQNHNSQPHNPRNQRPQGQHLSQGRKKNKFGTRTQNHPPQTQGRGQRQNGDEQRIHGGGNTSRGGTGRPRTGPNRAENVHL